MTTIQIKNKYNLINYSIEINQFNIIIYNNTRILQFFCDIIENTNNFTFARLIFYDNT